jgi:preprotein translocase subunit SecG
VGKWKMARLFPANNFTLFLASPTTILFACLLLLSLPTAIINSRERAEANQRNDGPPDGFLMYQIAVSKGEA